MKVLTVKQPWASLIIYGYQGIQKDIENRNWSLPAWMVGKRVAIHSSAKLDMVEVYGAQDLISHRGLPELDLNPHDLPLGKVLGTVDLVYCVTKSDSPWFVGEYGFVLHNPQAFLKPIPAKGMLGFWEWELPADARLEVPHAD